MFERAGPAITRIVALGITALAAFPSARAAEPKEVHIDLGSGGTSLVATVHVEDYRAAPLDLLTPAATHDSSMTRFLKTYFEVAKAGDTKKFTSLFAPDVGAKEDDHHTPQSLREQFGDLRSVRLSAVLYWGDHQFGFVQYEAADGEGGTRRWTWAHDARCVGNSCQITGHYKNSLLGRIVTTAFANKGGEQVAVPTQSETLPILPAVADASKKAAATYPIVLHLKRSSDAATSAAKTVVSTFTKQQPTFQNLAGLYSAGTPKKVEVFHGGNDVSAYDYSAYVAWFTKHAPWTVDKVYSLSQHVSVALLKSDKGRALHFLPMQQAANGWTLISDPSSLDAWPVLSSISTYQALRNPSARAADAPGTLRLKYLGAAGWELEADGLVVLIDPFISRIKYDGGGRADDPRKDFALTDLAESDVALIDKIVTRADFILLHHTHPDHALDVPYIARKTGAKVIGTETAKNLMRAGGVPEQQLYAVRGGEDYQFERFSVRVIPSLHSALNEKRYFSSRRHGPELQGPLRIEHFTEGGSLMFLCRINGTEVLTMGSMNFIENELRDLRPDILLAGAGSSRTEIYKYTERLLKATGSPRIVIPTHWDDFNVPYEDQATLDQARKEKAEPFILEVAAASPKSRTVIPVHLKTIAVRNGTISQN